MPFADYKNFADCVRKNASKKDPQAYCATIMRATEADLSTEKRTEYAKKGIAMSDGSYPIPDVNYLRKAIKAFGRSPDNATKNHIIKRARALGRTDLLPQDWKGSTAKENMDPQPVVKEIIDVSEAVFSKDETSGKMSARIKIIAAGKAQGKPRRYSSQAIRKAAKEGVYDGIRMFVNHSDKPPTKRGMGELVSAVEGTTYDPKQDAVMGDVEFFSKDFFDYAQRARKHIGVSADHRIRVNYVQEGGTTIEDVQEIVGARSVDWVVYPAAGGEIISFAQESKGVEDVEWSEITPELLKEHAPEVYALIAKESDPGPDDDPDEEPDEGDEKNKKVKESFTRSDVAKMVKESVEEILTSAEQKSQKRIETTKKVREFVSKSGLPGRTRDRIINQFADATEYVEANVKEAVDDAKEELKEAGAGRPKITGMGASGSKEGETESHVMSVREGVESLFIKKPATKESAASGKES